MVSDLIFRAVLFVLASIFLIMIYLARSKERSVGVNRFLLFAGSSYAFLGVVLVFVGILGMSRGFHGSPVPGAVISLAGLLLAAVSGIISIKARSR